jgi:transposase
VGFRWPLYDIDDRSKPFTPDDRRSFRQSQALPLFVDRGDYLASNAMANVMPKEPVGQAISYLRNNIEALRLHLDDGLVPIEENKTEQLMKQFALGRKNLMFIGSIDAGTHSADLITVGGSAVRNDLDVFTYLKDVLDKPFRGSRDF